MGNENNSDDASQVIAEVEVLQLSDGDDDEENGGNKYQNVRGNSDDNDDDDDSLEVTAVERLTDVESQSIGGKHDSATSTSVESNNKLPVGWKESVSKSTGKTFYFCAATGETRWTRPTEELTFDLPAGWKQAVSGNDLFFFHSQTKKTQWTVPKIGDENN